MKENDKLDSPSSPLNIDSFGYRQAKSFSVVFNKKKKHKEEPPQYSRTRCLSYAFPKNFVPKMGPRKAKMKPSQLKLNKRSNTYLKPITEVKENEKSCISLDNERRDSFGSIDSDNISDREFELDLLIETPDDLTKSTFNSSEKKVQNFSNLRKVMTYYKEKTFNFNFRDDNNPSIFIKRKLPQEFQDIKTEKAQSPTNYRHTVGFKAKNKGMLKGFSIMNILEMTKEQSENLL